ncbi:MAG: zf-HC2 domain-containing protein [Acidobacteriota bacterium]|nr:zf-HC2 domain-containing protein [Acidobacteriota bacterium]
MALRIYSKLTHALRWYLLQRLPTCKQMVALMSESMERQLSFRERVLVRLHLWVCIWCVWYMEQLRLMRDALRLRSNASADYESTVSLSDEARERLKLALNRREQ